VKFKKLENVHILRGLLIVITIICVAQLICEN
jgi:hypothetical protein